MSSPFHSLLDDIRDVFGLVASHVQEVWRVAGLIDADEEAIGKVSCAMTMQSGHPVSPFVGEGDAVSAENFDSRPLRPGGSKLEPCGEDNAVQIILFAVGNDAFRCNTIDSFAFGVNQVYIWEIESLQIVVMKTRSLAESRGEEQVSKCLDATALLLAFGTLTGCNTA